MYLENFISKIIALLKICYEDKDKSSLSEVQTWHLWGVDEIYWEQYFCLCFHEFTLEFSKAAGDFPHLTSGDVV